MARVLGIDFGLRRVGLAISDASGTLARPLLTARVSSAHEAVERVIQEITRLATDDEPVSQIVVGIPKRLDGSATDETRRAEAFVAALGACISVPIAREDERLTSREAESRLAEHEHDWRIRKLKLDAAAAAIILQDYLDRRRSGPSTGSGPP
jgi:putative holliday junction resolvase